MRGGLSSAMRETEAERGSWAATPQATPTSWGSGAALKRSASADRENGNENGRHFPSHLEQHAAAAREVAVQLNFRSKSGHFRAGSKGAAKGSGWSGSLELYKIALSMVALCFLAITLMQGSMVLILKHTAFLTLPDEAPDAGRTLLPVGVSDCERALQNAVRNFTEKLPRRSGLAELRKWERNWRRPPRLALVCPDLDSDPDTVYLSTIARGLRSLGYGLELIAREEGHLQSGWEEAGVPVHIVREDSLNITIDWPSFDGVLALSLDAKKILDSLVQEPFTDIPLIWVIYEDVVLEQDIAWNATDELQAVYRSWLQAFDRTSVLVFPNYFLPMLYTDFYREKFFVVPGSPWDVWKAQQFMAITQTAEDIRANAGLGPENYVLVVVGSPCSSKEIWREHAIVMKAVANLTSADSVQEWTETASLFFVGQGNSGSDYQEVLQMIAKHVGLEDEVQAPEAADQDVLELLWMADAVLYASLWEELSVPPILLQAMTLKRPVIVPDVGAIREQIVDMQSGFLYPAGDDQILGEVLALVRSEPALARSVAEGGAALARNLLARDAVVEYGQLLEKILDFPEEARLPPPVAEMAEEWVPAAWAWDAAGAISAAAAPTDRSKVKDLAYLKSATDLRFVANLSLDADNDDDEDPKTATEAILNGLPANEWVQERLSTAAAAREQVEHDLMVDRLDQVRPTFEDVNKMVKKTETRVSQEKHLEVDHLEVERVAQPLCIYELYHGPGAWPFLHEDHVIYRGLSLSAEGRRRYLGDVDGPKLLALVNSSYYRDAFCDLAGLFALAKRVDRVHWNPWIGFQPWRASAKRVALTAAGEDALLAEVSKADAADALYFWAQLDSEEEEGAGRSVAENDFWTSCDAANAGNCRSVFLETFKEMYGLPSSWTQLPPMPAEGGAWAAMHCWALPTTSFSEFVMFARMFVNALDALQYESHHDRGRCCFKGSQQMVAEVKHCYCNFVERLVNVWAYHSGRRMIYLDPSSGDMREQHNLTQRADQMWARWFNSGLLKGMDEDLAEEADDEAQAHERWLWPETGEVVWEGTREKDRRERFAAKVEKKRKQMERQAQQSRYKQKALGKVLKTKTS